MAWLFALSFSSVAFGNSTFIVEITAESLNVRDQPTTKGEIISSFKKGEKIVASTSYPGWVMVLINGNTFGYISSKYIKILKVVSTEKDSSFYEDGEEIRCNADSANLNLNISNVEMKCKEDLFGEGYESCNVWFDITIDSDCDESMTAYVDCEVEIKYETKDGFLPSRASEYSSETIYLNYGHGSGQVEVSLRPRVIMDDVVRVKLNDASCSISSVYDQ